MNRSNDDQNYQVGYGKPPESSRFKAGRSGNPKGRPKGSLNFATVLEQTLRETVVINEDGRRKTITKLEAALKQLTNKAAGGDLGAVKQLCGLIRSAEERIPETPDTPVDICEADQKLMQRLLSKLEGSATDQKEEEDESN
jgi:hypothetical protein